MGIGPAMFANNCNHLHRYDIVYNPVSAISVDPRPITSRMGRQVFEVVGPSVRQLDWGMELVEGDHGLLGQHTEHRLPNHVFIGVIHKVVLKIT